MKKTDIIMVISFHIKDSWLVVNVEADLTSRDSTEFYKSVLEKFDENKPDVEVHFGKINIIDSSGLSSIVNIFKTVDKAGKRFKLTGCSEKMKKVFKLTKLDRIMPVE